MRNFHSLPVIFSAARRSRFRCPVMLSSLGNDEVSASDSCIVDSYIDSLVDWAIACASESLNKCEWDLKAGR
jgi:hypothetical protein